MFSLEEEKNAVSRMTPWLYEHLILLSPVEISGEVSSRCDPSGQLLGSLCTFLQIHMPLYVAVLRPLHVKDNWWTSKNVSVDLFNSAIRKSEMYQVSLEVKKLSVSLGFGFIFCALGLHF